MKSLCLKFNGTIFAILVFSTICLAQSSSFTYQGSFVDAGVPATGAYDFTFRLFAAAGGGTQIGPDVVINDAQVAAGIFTVTLDFGSSPFTSTVGNFLEISVRNGASTGTFTLLNPRQPLASAPYAVQAAVARDSNQLGGVPASQYVVTTDARMTDARNPLPASGNYIWNQNSVLQPSSNFVISGNGDVGGTLAANIVRAATQYNIGVNRVLSVAGQDNVFVGLFAGLNTTGNANSFFGSSAGAANTSGIGNSFFGRHAGLSNTEGLVNSFFGTSAGRNNLTGDGNAFFGGNAGMNNTEGNFNSFFGNAAGINNSTASSNSFFGNLAGSDNDLGFANSFFGANAGDRNTSGSANSFFGERAGEANLNANDGAFFGRWAGLANTSGEDNSFFGSAAGLSNNQGSSNSFFGQASGSSTSTGSSNSFFGRSAGNVNTTGSNNTIIGSGANVGANDLTYAAAFGAGAVAPFSNTMAIGRPDGSDQVLIPGRLNVGILAAQGTTSLCRNNFDYIATCSSSLRYKTNINRFGLGLRLVDQLKPITFDWKDGGMRDLGLGAEDVAAIEPLLVTYNKNGEIEGVKYDRIGVVLINAVKQQQQIIERQNMRIEELVRLVCLTNKEADICKEK